jgi:hypothetical protein
VTAKNKPVPIFVVGSPRSGTTLVGNFIGSSSAVCNLQEFGGFYLTRFLIEYHLAKRMPCPSRQKYLGELRTHATRFAARQARAENTRFYLDATPGNLLIAKTLAEEFPKAIFVLLLRHYSGVVLSLRRSFLDGYAWAGKSWEERALVWRSFYSNVIFLPQDRTIIVNYDLLCSRPNKCVGMLTADLRRHQVGRTDFDLCEFLKGHATSRTDSHRTIGVLNKRGQICLRRVSSYDVKRWSSAIHNRVRPIVHGVDGLLCELFGSKYFSPIR